LALELEHIRRIADRVASSLGLEVVDVEFRGGTGKQGRALRITIDREAPTATDNAASVMGITHDDCANVSREVSTILDVEDVVPGGEYLLEVSSPGLDRRLVTERDFKRFVGSRIRLMTREPIGVTERSKGTRHFEGRLESFAEGRLRLDVAAARKKGKGKHPESPTLVEITWENVERANLVPEI
jgi:ribosome maturation factor RimP